ncbi:MAG: 50S ribosomal protein L22 [Patescibacteria group bacterium]|nr:50S ribosomal protein L22 [Patescibacteria group bacterium]
MQVRARLKNFRMSAKKARLVADLVRGKKTDQAAEQLRFRQGKACNSLLGLMDSAVANAWHNFGLDRDNLYIEKVKIDAAPAMKRWRPRAHGRTYPILKRSCHMEIILNEVEEGKGRRKVEKKQGKTLTYKELKKMSDQAEKILSKQKGKKDKEKVKEKQEKIEKKGDSGGGMISKIFRRKSI